LYTPLGTLQALEATFVCEPVIPPVVGFRELVVVVKLQAVPVETSWVITVIGTAVVGGEVTVRVTGTTIGLLVACCAETVTVPL
jgi:hypothetical protein